MRARLSELVEAADLNELLRAVDSLCAERSWEDLLVLAERCEAAVERGKQLWPISEHIHYRVALEAPPHYAAMVLSVGPARFAHGPLSEVAASTHTWDDLAPEIESPQAAAYVAQERVLRGEDLTGDTRAHPDQLELPLALEEWEPTYCLATFARDHVEVAEPWEPRIPLAKFSPSHEEELDDADLENALLELVQAWTTESNGAARAAVVDGDARAAVSALTYGSFRMGPLDLAEAVQRMAWAAASGGAHGRRRGAALGRFATWFALAQLTGSGWPADGARLGSRAARLRWQRWDEGSPEKGWVLRLAVEDPDAGWAAAIAATDLLDEE